MKRCPVFDAEASALAEHDWLAGSQFSLVDVSWMPLHFTLKNMARFDFTPYPHVEAWSQRISQRPSYQSAIVDWYPKNIPQPTETAA